MKGIVKQLISIKWWKIEDFPVVQLLYLRLNTKSTRLCPPTDRCTQVGVFKNVHSTWEKFEIIA